MILRWLLIIVPISVAVGSVVALFKPDPETRRLMLIAGVAAGFGACFGTPLARGV